MTEKRITLGLSEITTLIELLTFRAETSPDQVAFTFEEQAHTYAEVWSGVRHFGSYLLNSGVVPGDRILMTLPNGPDFFSAFYGTQYAGAVAVPVFPGADPERINHLAALCKAKRVVVEATRSTTDLKRPSCCVPEAEDTVVLDEHPSVKPEDVAFIQYTSGSTGDPKGVLLTHRNVLANIRQMIVGMQIRVDDVFVSWLPVYHDMGLILKTMVPFYLGARLHLMPASLRRVHHWPELIERYRGTFTAAPDIAYRLCIRSMRHKKHDLSSLRVALNAAEPVRLETIQAFEAHFGLVQVMVAGYGLAEATVGVCMWTPGQAPEVDADRHVSVGKSFPDIEIKIVADEQPVEAGAVGEIMIRSPANTQGYFENPEATRSLFWNTDYIRSGDLGYLNENGELFIVGRKKNIIIHAGETIYPADVEELVNTLPNVRYSVAVGIDRGGIEGEQVYVFVESWGSTRSDDGFQDLVIEIVDRFYQRFGFRPGRVYIVKPRTIPVTPNGKMQHLRLKDLYLSGSLSRDKQILYPEY